MGNLGWFQYLNNSFLQGMQAKWGVDRLDFCAIFFESMTMEVTNRAFDFWG